MSYKGEKMIEDYVSVQVNGYNCYMRYGIMKHKSYLINDCLNDYSKGRPGLFRVMALGIYGANNTSSFGAFIPYFIKQNYDFVEDVFIFTKEGEDFNELSDDEQETSCNEFLLPEYDVEPNLRVIVTTSREYEMEEEILLNTTLVKLLTNQMLKNINNEENCDIKNIYIEVFDRNKKTMLEFYNRIKAEFDADDDVEDFDFYDKEKCDFFSYLQVHIDILKKYNELENFKRNVLNKHSDIKKFFFTNDLMEEYSIYEKKCMEMFEKEKKFSFFKIKKQ